MNPNLKFSDQVTLLGVIDPDANAAAAYSTGWVDAGMFAKFGAVIKAGDLGSSATLDAKIEQATSSAGAGAKDVTGKAITQLTQAGTDSNKQAIINFSGADLDVANGFAWVRLTMTVGTATSDCDGELWGILPRQAIAADASTVDEVVG